MKNLKIRCRCANFPTVLQETLQRNIEKLQLLVTFVTYQLQVRQWRLVDNIVNICVNLLAARLIEIFALFNCSTSTTKYSYQIIVIIKSNKSWYHSCSALKSPPLEATVKKTLTFEGNMKSNLKNLLYVGANLQLIFGYICVNFTEV